MDIEKETWHTCKLCQQNIKTLAKIYGGENVYYTKVFRTHLLKDHQQSLSEYFVRLYTQPVCKCGVCNQRVDISIKGSNFEWRNYMCGRNPGTLAWSERAKKSRCGTGNPMYGRASWNNGLTKETSDIMLSNSKKLTGRKISDGSKAKMSDAAKIRLVHGHTGCLHSEASKQKIREATLRRIKNGDFKQLSSKPHLAMKAILEEMGLVYEEEYRIAHWSFDFRLEAGILIEVDGDYFHSNPKIYTNGPKSNTQKINHSRDIRKNQFCKDNNLPLLRFWECDILSTPDKIKQEIECHTKKLLESGK